MNIVLLSGGSGKRLWPLSNDVRSKQFLKVLKSSNGQRESMLQRVYRQICDEDIASLVVISTTYQQSYIIKEQLGNKVGLVIEPERRNTFPAIALSAMYLFSEKNIQLDETILY